MHVNLGSELPSITGPQGVWSDHFHYRWNPQLYAAAGYAVLAVNPHGMIRYLMCLIMITGSIGFGQAFTDAVCKNWGGAPYQGILDGYDKIS